MERGELLEKITTLPLIAGFLAEDLLAGDFSSVFRGQGIEFDEVRHYERGDDIRSIDWNASARFGTPFVKMYREERELTVLIVLDCSGSMRAGGTGEPGRSRYEQAVLTAALIAFSAERTGQRTGALFFDRGVIRIFPPKKGRRHTMAILGGALSLLPGAPAGKGTDAGGRGMDSGGSNLEAALAGAGRLLKKRSLVVLISDFFCVNWEQGLGDLCRKHDVIAIRIEDPLDAVLPDAGLVPMEDPETGYAIHAPTGFDGFRAAWEDWHADRAALWESICRRAGAARLVLSCRDDPSAALFRFFGGRRSSHRRPSHRRHA
ncbi:MAG: DUF58 domain-containing protein [Treponema sp.]|nr:DUF58 domain-containing protein [Treponema sp.]